jgi:hypothetical protein
MCVNSLAKVRCLANGVLASRCLAMDIYSDFIIPAFSRHVTVLFTLIVYLKGFRMEHDVRKINKNEDFSTKITRKIAPLE